MSESLDRVPGSPVNFSDAFYFVPEEFNPDDIIIIAGDQVDNVPFYPEPSGDDLNLISLVQIVNQPADDLPPAHLLADTEIKTHSFVGIRLAKTVDTGY